MGLNLADPAAPREKAVGAYLRLGADGFDPAAVAAAAGRRLAFVDLGETNLDSLRRAEDALTDVAPALVHLDALIFRWPELTTTTDTTRAAFADTEILGWLQRLTQRRLASFGTVAVGAAQFAVGEAPRLLAVRAGVPADLDERSVLAKCRNAEIRALMRLGSAVWKPDSYHFRLPGGQHSSTFIRLADAIRSPRDAHVLATWLVGDLQEHRGTLVDSASLTPILTELTAQATLAGWSLGPTVFLQDYPRTRVGVIEAARSAVGLSGRIHGIVSVNSSGRVLDLLTESLTVVAPNSWSVDVLVDKKRNPGSPQANQPISTWAGVHDPNASPAAPDAGCALCRDPRRARLLYLDPRSFEPFLLPSPVLQHPDTSDAYRNRGLYRLAADTGAIGVECLPSRQGTPRGRRERMAVRFFHKALLADTEAFLTLAAQRIRAITDSADPTSAAVLAAMSDCDLVVVAEDEFSSGDGPLTRAVIDGLCQALGMPARRVVSVNTRTDALRPSNEDLPALQQATRPLVLAIGSVTGWTLRRLRDTTRQYSAATSQAMGLVLHSRPQSWREWHATEDMFAGRCAALWQTFLTWDSPLREESDLLGEYRQWLSDALPVSTEARASAPGGPTPSEDGADLAYLEVRLEIANPPDSLADWTVRTASTGERVGRANPRAVLWGPAGSEPVRGDRGPFGRDLDELATYVAVGSALQRTRVDNDEREGPFWRAFNIRDAIHQRLDGVSLAALLRWLRPAEAWWGEGAADARETANIARVFMEETFDEYSRFLPEALLATAQGKVHPGAARVFQSWAVDCLDDTRLQAPLTLGLRLVDWARPTGM